MIEPHDLPENPPPPARPVGTAVRPMSITAAAGWASGTVLSFWMLMVFFAPRAALNEPGAAAEVESDIIGNAACQAVTYLLGLFLILRSHAPSASIRDFLGIRRTHVGFYAIAVLLGVAIELPVQALYSVIARRWPSSPEADDRLLRLFVEAGTAKKIAIGVIIIALGPLIEEIFFRGALFRPLRKRYTAGSVVVITSIFFSVSHGLPQMFLPIAIVGLAMGVVRVASGSLVPSLLLHATFNAIPFYALATSKPGVEDTGDAMPPLWMTMTGTAVAAALVGLAYVLGARASTALRAQEADRQ